MEAICTKLYSQFYSSENISIAKYKILYPLLRLGIIEFYGAGTYALSPSCCIKGKSYLTWLNAPFKTSEFLKKSIINYYHNSLFITDIKSSCLIHAKEQAIPTVRFNFKSSLSQIRGFDQVIANWHDEIVVDESLLQPFTEMLPQIMTSAKAETPKTGIFKSGKEAYSSRLLKMDAIQWKSIPNRKQNIDAFNIAAFYCLIKQDFVSHISYDRKTNSIAIQNWFFPIIIERLLALHTMTELGQIPDCQDRKYFIWLTEFELLNRLFNHKIPVL